MRLRLTGLWRHTDFLKLWAGQSVSMFGSQITFLALPLTAVLVLDASPVQMGILTAMEGVPPLLGGVLVGAWLDRRSRRPVLIAANWGRALLLVTVPAAALLGVLRMEHLYLIAAGLGALSLVFDVAYRSYLPSLIGRGRLVEGNSKLEVSRSAAEVGGPGVGGTLVQIASAPVALLVDAFTFVVSALSVQFIRAPEPAPAEGRRGIWRESGEGLRVVWSSPVLRALAATGGTVGLFNAMLEAVFILYMSNRLGLSAGLIGFIFSTGGAGLLAGALLEGRTTRWIGLGPSIIVGVVLVALSDLVLPLASGPTVAVVVLLVMAQFFFGFGLTTYNIGNMSLRQTITPDHLQGRVNAVMRVVLVGTVPVGALLGGALGEAIDLRPTLFVAVAGEMVAVFWLLLSPVRSLREQPETGLTDTDGQSTG